MMKCEWPSVQVCPERTVGRSRRSQGGPIIFYEIRFGPIRKVVLDRLPQRFPQSLLGLESLSCPNQQKSIQGLNMLRSGNGVQFHHANLGFPAAQASCHHQQLPVSVSVPVPVEPQIETMNYSRQLGESGVLGAVDVRTVVPSVRSQLALALTLTTA
jgi:hypothetical protein